MPVAALGRPAPQAPWQAFQDRTGIPVVIDGAAAIESLFARPDLYLGNIPVALSLHATKAFSSGEGGAVACTDDALWRATMQTLNFGFDLDRLSKTPSTNGKMSEYHAAVGLAELDRWETKLAAYRHAAKRLKADDGLSEKILVGPTIGSNYALFMANDGAAAETQEALAAASIESRIWYGGGLHIHPYCQQFERDALPVTERLARTLVGIPMSVDLTDTEIYYIRATLLSVQ